MLAVDRDVVMRLAPHPLGRQFAVRQEGIGGAVLALNVQCIQQRNEPPDVIGLLGLLAPRDGQGPDFFGV